MSEIKIRIAISRFLLILLLVPYEIEWGYHSIILDVLLMPLFIYVEVAGPDFQHIASFTYIFEFILLVFPLMYFPVLLLMNWWITYNENRKRLISHRTLLFLSLILVLRGAIISRPLDFGNWLVLFGITAAALAELWIIFKEKNNLIE